MRRFWFGPRKKDEDKIKARNEQLAKLRRLIHIGGHEAEPQYVELLKLWKPEIGEEELKQQIRLYHDAVSDRQVRDRESR